MAFSKETYAKMLKELAQDEYGEVTIFAESVAFQGFDPSRTLKLILERGAKKGKNSQSIMKEMLKFCIFYTKRGTNFKSDNFNARTTAVGIKLINEISGDYDIKPNLGGVNHPDTLTIGRVVACFSEIVGAIYLAGVSTPIVRMENGPIWCSFPGGATLMSDVEWENYKDDYVTMMVTFNQIVNRKKTDKDVAKSSIDPTLDIEIQKSQQLAFSESTRNSAYSTELRATKREALMRIAESLKKAFKTDADLNAGFVGKQFVKDPVFEAQVQLAVEKQLKAIAKQEKPGKKG